MSDTPWDVVYLRPFPEWHPQARPAIVNCRGNILLEMPQSDDVGHPGEYDMRADLLAKRIVAAVNSVADAVESKPNANREVGQYG